MADATVKRQEERVKLFATALSNLGVATVVTGLIGPALAGRASVLGTMTVFVIGFVLHMAGQGVLHFVVRIAAEGELA